MKVSQIWIDEIAFPKVDITNKDSEGRKFLQTEMVIRYTAYKSGNHLWHGEFKCSYHNEFDIDLLSLRILNEINNDADKNNQ